MTRVRRSEYVHFAIRHGRTVDVAALLRGEIAAVEHGELVALAPLTGRTVTITRAQLDLLLATSTTRATPAAELGTDDATIAALLDAGILVADDGELARREERLRAAEWHPSAALHHFMTRWRDVDAGEQADALAAGPGVVTERWRTFVGLHGAPPAPVDAPRPHAIPLPGAPLPPALADVLRARRTTRRFDRDAPLPLDALSTVLYSTWGCQGYARTGEDVTILKKTSPSGGSRHSVEAYALVLNAEGLEPGLYHYGVARHELEPLRPLEPEEARRLASVCSSGQWWAADASVLFLLTSRFYRTFWKYRRHERVYTTLFMDVGHLSQTFFLVCAELGLGAFFVGAVNGANIEEELGLDPAEEGALALCGCGYEAPGEPALRPDFAPYVPRITDASVLGPAPEQDPAHDERADDRRGDRDDLQEQDHS